MAANEQYLYVKQRSLWVSYCWYFLGISHQQHKWWSKKLWHDCFSEYFDALVFLNLLLFIFPYNLYATNGGHRGGIALDTQDSN